MSSKPTLADAIALAASVHRDQVDKAGEPYILHPLRVMLRLSNETERLVGVLHDVLEDGNVTAAELRANGYAEDVVAAVDALTKRDEESYEEFIERVAGNPLARRVKLADLEDNMDPGRPLPTDPEERKRHPERRARYRRAWELLSAPTTRE
jgi:(p)ppGpp synthase/HD superfamily hydrolase